MLCCCHVLFSPWRSLLPIFLLSCCCGAVLLFIFFFPFSRFFFGVYGAVVLIERKKKAREAICLCACVVEGGWGTPSFVCLWGGSEISRCSRSKRTDRQKRDNGFSAICSSEGMQKDRKHKLTSGVLGSQIVCPYFVFLWFSQVLLGTLEWVLSFFLSIRLLLLLVCLVFFFLGASWDLGGVGLSYGRENLLKLLENWSLRDGYLNLQFFFYFCVDDVVVSSCWGGRGWIISKFFILLLCFNFLFFFP